ncbi:MAG: chemotaxis protein CheA [Candidatus Devosia phytovorans]|uniref:Chemotaxis protein CheA n=1 Tax=Candidatus Devosia phytovorans TaxID=3121372 RepID=A0AAJ5VVT9_9HYPH|nr:chemotaxis protein CheA [Devosia sp.]WEK04353.1 MAG: chemotaxis protein CheA [Devosia sp.]
MDELMAQFIVESRELVQSGIKELVALQAEPADRAHLDAAFRTVHTLKGAVGLFDLAPLQTTLHKAEDVLGQVRASAAAIDGAQVEALIDVLEWIELCVDDIERDGAVSDERSGRALALALGLVSDSDTVATPVSPAPQPAMPDWIKALRPGRGKTATVAIRYVPHPEAFFSGDDPLALVATVPDLLDLRLASREPWPDADKLDPFRANLVMDMLSGAPLATVEAIFRMVPDQVQIVPLRAAVAEAPETNTAMPAARTLRIDAGRIDAIMDIVGELITTRNGMASQLAALVQGVGDREAAGGLAASQKAFDQIVAQLHGAVLRTRMVPLSQASRRLPRMVRELATRLGKPTSFEMRGESIEVDKSIVDELFEPLLHIVRNAMDHGIEAEAERLASGKSIPATLVLFARRQGDRVIITIKDDGRGIDPDAIRTAAVSRGLIASDRAGALSDDAAVDLLFTPGFSTAKTVSDLSGRGVGLDAVRSNVARFGGRVELNSRRGQGTEVILTLPLSFAMTQLLVVSVGGERYGIAMDSVLETVRVLPKNVSAIRSGRAFVLRDRTIPLLSLAQLLQLDDVQGDQELTVLMVAVGEERIGLVVDAIAERTETVTRPLSGLLTGMAGIAGTTLTGDGKVLLVLDLGGLIGWR